MQIPLDTENLWRLDCVTQNALNLPRAITPAIREDSAVIFGTRNAPHWLSGEGVERTDGALVHARRTAGEADGFFHEREMDYTCTYFRRDG